MFKIKGTKPVVRFSLEENMQSIIETIAILNAKRHNKEDHCPICGSTDLRMEHGVTVCGEMSCDWEDEDTTQLE